jgi:hypothetical protein
MTGPEQAGRWALTGRRLAIVGVGVTVLAAGAVVVLTQKSTPSPVKSTLPASTTTVKPRPKPKPKRVRPVKVAPLTGLPEPSVAAQKRCAITVKIGNTPEARPQYGVEQADVVYEEVVEGGITRLAAVFQSQAPDRVGPIRSVRPTDHSIVWPLKGILAFSGGNAIEVNSIGAAPVARIDETAAGPLMFRDPTRQAPHNLYAHVDQMFSACGAPAPQPLFRFRKGHAAPAGTKVSTVNIGYEQGYAVSWAWGPLSHTWKRSIFGGPDGGAAGGQFNAANVVVMSVGYLGGPGAADGEGVLVGAGPLRVFTAGRLITGTWVRPDLNKPARLLDSRHRPIALTPGRTWVELPDTTYAVTTTP